jgi:hypothetical protein
LVAVLPFDLVIGWRGVKLRGVRRIFAFFSSTYDARVNVDPQG